MPKALKDLMNELSPEDRAYVEQRGEEMYQEALTLQESRKAQEIMTQDKE